MPFTFWPSWPGWFTPLAGNAWVAPSGGVAVKQVFADGARLAPTTQADPALVEPGAFGWFPGVGLVVNVGGGNPADHGLAVSIRTHGFLLSGRNHIQIEGFTITRTESKGIEVLGGSGVQLKNNIIDGSFAGGIAVENATQVLVRGNRVSDCNHHGIEFRGGVTGSVIERAARTRLRGAAGRAPLGGEPGGSGLPVQARAPCEPPELCEGVDSAQRPIRGHHLIATMRS